MRIRFPSPRRAVARLFNSKEKIKRKKKATVESHVRDCDSMRIINFSEDGRHGVGQSTDSSPSTIGSGKHFIIIIIIIIQNISIKI